MEKGGQLVGGEAGRLLESAGGCRVGDAAGVSSGGGTRGPSGRPPHAHRRPRTCDMRLKEGESRPMLPARAGAATALGSEAAAAAGAGASLLAASSARGLVHSRRDAGTAAWVRRTARRTLLVLGRASAVRRLATADMLLAEPAGNAGVYNWRSRVSGRAGVARI